VPANLESIKVEITAQVMNSITKSMQSFSANDNFNLFTHKNDGTTFELHLRVVEGRSYEVECLGKNGEPRPLVRVNVHLIHARVGTKTSNLVSDKHGKIYLGKLDHVLSI
jgi:hypothetical protein